MKKYWISKYALTKGIFEIEAERPTGKGYNGSMICECNSFSGNYHGEGREWHNTKEEAVKRAEELRTAKIKSLKKQIEKLEKMTFE